MTTKKELKDYCRKKGIKGYSQLNKLELEKLINSYKNNLKKESLHRKVNLEMIKSKSKSKTTKKNLLEILKKDIKEWDPSGEYSQRGRIYVDEEYGNVETDFRHLGRWKSNEEDDDFPVWSSKSYSKYAKEFSNWAKRKPWYKRVETSVDTNEKAWASFSLTIKK